MKILIAISALILLQGCMSSSVSDFFDRLEFKEGQEGCIRANGQVAVGDNPFLRTTVNVNMVKTQGEDAPDC
jgi:hypothetical protein